MYCCQKALLNTFHVVCQQSLYLLMFDRGQVECTPRQLPVSPKLISAKYPFALFWVVWDYLDSVDPRHPFDDLCFVTPKVPRSLERYVHIYLSTVNGMQVLRSTSIHLGVVIHRLVSYETNILLVLKSCRPATSVTNKLRSCVVSTPRQLRRAWAVHNRFGVAAPPRLRVQTASGVPFVKGTGRTEP